MPTAFRNTILLMAGAAAGLLAAPAPAQDRQADACADAVQGQVAWNYEGNRNWASNNIERLCAGAGDTTQPAHCFERVMHGGVNWGGGVRWKWENALDLCRGTHDADGTIDCFESRIGDGLGWRRAIAACRWDTPTETAARRIDDGDPPEREARRVESTHHQGESHRVSVGEGESSTTATDMMRETRAETGDDWGRIRADSGLCLTLNVFDRPTSRKKKIKKAFKKMFDPREHAKTMAGAAGAGLVFGPGGPELVHSIQALRQAKKVSEGWQGDLRHGMGVTLLECGAVDAKYQAFRRDGYFFEARSGHCFKGKQGQADENGGRVQLGGCKNQQRTAWYVNGGEFRNGKGKCLDVHAPDRDKEGARVQLWDCNGAPQQRWTYTGD